MNLCPACGKKSAIKYGFDRSFCIQRFRCSKCRMTFHYANIINSDKIEDSHIVAEVLIQKKSEIEAYKLNIIKLKRKIEKLNKRLAKADTQFKNIVEQEKKSIIRNTAFFDLEKIINKSNIKINQIIYMWENTDLPIEQWTLREVSKKEESR